MAAHKTLERDIKEMARKGGGWNERTLTQAMVLLAGNITDLHDKMRSLGHMTNSLTEIVKDLLQTQTTVIDKIDLYEQRNTGVSVDATEITHSDASVITPESK